MGKSAFAPTSPVTEVVVLAIHDWQDGPVNLYVHRRVADGLCRQAGAVTKDDWRKRDVAGQCATHRLDKSGPTN